MSKVNEDSEFKAAVLKGLARRPRRIPCRFLYDQRGAALFEEICTLDEYYPTRTECALLARHAHDIAAIAGEQPRLLEFGGCTPAKARYLLDAARPSAYIPVDICGEALAASCLSLSRERPELDVIPIHADFTRPFALPSSDDPLLGFFPGSTIGNMTPLQAVTFLAGARRRLGPDGAMVVGVDLKKAHDRLYRAYNDHKGTTAAFLLNVLRRVNDELGADFDLGGFAHSALYHAGQGRMEMFLVSRRSQRVQVAGRCFKFGLGDSIHIEDSHKYTVGEFQSVARAAGFEPVAAWCDDAKLFSLHLLRPVQREKTVQSARPMNRRVG